MSNTPHPVYAVYDGKFNTASGKTINLLDPDPASIWIEDIAASLSKTCRFGGQTNAFYSVAQHCCMVSDLAPERLKLPALLHDASEAYLGDVIKPLKVIIADSYCPIEDRFMEAICMVFNIDTALMAEIKPYDQQALLIEHELLQRNNPAPYLELTKTKYIDFWQPQYAEEMFIATFDFLTNKRLNNVHKPI
jgi:uncharacterized protein